MASQPPVPETPNEGPVDAPIPSPADPIPAAPTAPSPSPAAITPESVQPALTKIAEATATGDIKTLRTLVAAETSAPSGAAFVDKARAPESSIRAAVEER